MTDREDGNGVPIIVGANAKIGVLERRLDHLQRRLREDGYRSAASAEFDRTEAEALRAGIRALRFHASRLQPDSDPVVALDKLVEACTQHLTGHLADDEMIARVKRAASVLSEAA